MGHILLPKGVKPLRHKPENPRLNPRHPLYKYITFAVFDAQGRDIGPYKLPATGVATSGGPGVAVDGGRVIEFDDANREYYTYTAQKVISKDEPLTILARYKFTSAPTNFETICSLMGDANDGLTIGFSTHSSWRYLFLGEQGSSWTNSPQTSYRFSDAKWSVLHSTTEWTEICLEKGQGVQTSDWKLYSHGMYGSPVNGSTFNENPNNNVLGFADGYLAGREFPGKLDYFVVLRGINAADHFKSKQDVYALLESPIQSYFVPAAAVGTTINRVLNGRIFQDTQTTDANRVLNGSIFQEIAAAGGGTTINATNDALTLTEYAASVNAATSITATVDALTVTEYAATVNFGVGVDAGVDTLTLTEYAASINAAKNIAATVDNLTVTEYAASVNAGTNIDATVDSLTLTEYAANINAATTIQAAVDNLTVTEYQATVQAGNDTVINATSDALVLTEYQASVNAATNISAGVDALTLTEYQASITAGTEIAASVDNLTLTTYQATVALENTYISATVDALALTEYSAIISFAGDVLGAVTTGGGPSRKRKDGWWVVIDGERFWVRSKEEERALLQAVESQKVKEEVLAKPKPKKTVLPDEYSAHMARLRQEDEEILLILD